MKKKKTPLLVLFSIIVLLLLLLVPSLLRPGLTLVQEWVSDVNSYGFANDGDLTPFRLGDTFGFVGSGGEIYYRDTVIHNVVFGSNEFINYGSEDDVLYVSSSDGVILNTIPTSDYPFYKRGRLFTVGYDRQSLYCYSSSLEELYFPAVISDVDASSEHLVVGLLDNGIKAYDNYGSLVLDYLHEDSRISAVYSVAVSEDSNYLAAVVGIEKQYLLVFKFVDGRFERFIADVMPQEYRRNVVLEFVNSDTLVVENPEGINVLNLGTGNVRQYHLDGRYLNSGFVSGYFGVFILADGHRFLEIYSEAGESLVKTKLSEESTVIFKDEYFIVGENEKLSAFSLKNERG